MGVVLHGVVVLVDSGCFLSAGGCRCSVGFLTLVLCVCLVCVRGQLLPR